MYLRADGNSDHNSVVATVKLKIKSHRKRNRNKKLNELKNEDEKIRVQYSG